MAIEDYTNIDEHRKANLADDLVDSRNLLNTLLSQAALAGIAMNLRIGTRAATLATDRRAVPTVVVEPVVSPERADPPLVADDLDALLEDAKAAVRVFNRFLEAAALAGVLDRCEASPVMMVGAARQGIPTYHQVDAMPNVESMTTRMQRSERERILFTLAKASGALATFANDRSTDEGRRAMTAMYDTHFVLRLHRWPIPGETAPSVATVQ